MNIWFRIIVVIGNYLTSLNVESNDDEKNVSTVKKFDFFKHCLSLRINRFVLFIVKQNYTTKKCSTIV